MDLQTLRWTNLVRDRVEIRMTGAGTGIRGRIQQRMEQLGEIIKSVGSRSNPDEYQLPSLEEEVRRSRELAQEIDSQVLLLTIYRILGIYRSLTIGETREDQHCGFRLHSAAARGVLQECQVFQARRRRQGRRGLLGDPIDRMLLLEVAHHGES